MYDLYTCSYTDPDWEELDEEIQQVSCHKCDNEALQSGIRESLEERMLLPKHSEQVYHQNDFVLYSSDDSGPAAIGRIHKIRSRSGDTSRAVVLRCLGRVALLEQDTLPARTGLSMVCASNHGYNSFQLNGACFQERHLYLTQSKVEVDESRLIKPIFVLHPDETDIETMKDWLSCSDIHFYADFEFIQCDDHNSVGLDLLRPARGNKPARELQLGRQSPLSSIDAAFEQTYLLQEFLEEEKLTQDVLPTMDEFAGTGAFGQAMETVYPSITVTHAVEINDTAAETIR